MTSWPRLEAKKAEGQKIAAGGRHDRAEVQGRPEGSHGADRGRRRPSGALREGLEHLAEGRQVEHGQEALLRVGQVVGTPVHDRARLRGARRSEVVGYRDGARRTQIRAATVRAKINYHQAYEEAAKLGDGGDAAGASESRWLQGLDFEQTAEAVEGKKPLRTRRRRWRGLDRQERRVEGDAEQARRDLQAVRRRG